MFSTGQELFWNLKLKKNSDFNGFWFPVPLKHFLSIFGEDKRMFAGAVTETPMLSICNPRKKN